MKTRTTTTPTSMMKLAWFLVLMFQQQQQQQQSIHGFVLVPTTTTCSVRYNNINNNNNNNNLISLQAAAGDQKRKRKRKSTRGSSSPAPAPAPPSQQATTTPSPPPPPVLPTPKNEEEDDDEDDYDDDYEDDAEPTTTTTTTTTTSTMTSIPIPAKEKNLIDKIAQLELTVKTKKGSSSSSSIESRDDMMFSDMDDTARAADAASIPLPDIQAVLKQKKAIQQELERMEREDETEEDKRPRIKRTDKEAFRKLLEQQPYSDADDSFFEVEAYGTVSALLAERAKPFLGIPSGPLQVGHFMGALGIVLMAFIQYPGFPLTNLPSAVREALQGGLGCIYLINFVLALYVSVIGGVAKDRGQSPVLWGAKTLVVGGLALDQLTQLPTLAQIKEAEERKGKRALKKNKNKNK